MTGFWRGADRTYGVSVSLRVVRAQEKHPIVIDDADVEAVQPAETAQEVPVECLVLGEKDNRRELDAECVDGDLVLIGCKRSGGRSETLNPPDSMSNPSRSAYFRSKMQCAAPVSSLATIRDRPTGRQPRGIRGTSIP